MTKSKYLRWLGFVSVMFGAGLLALNIINYNGLSTVCALALILVGGGLYTAF